MDREQKLSSEQVTETIENLVKKIQDWDGSSGHAENEWRADQQELLRVLSEHPLQLHQLDEALKVWCAAIVDDYLRFSFNGYW